MNLELLILNGYGQFVWPAFIITFTSCLILYIKTKKELQKHEKLFLNEYKQIYTSSIETVEEIEIKNRAFSNNLI